MQVAAKRRNFSNCIGRGRIDIYVAWWMAVILSFSLQPRFDISLAETQGSIDSLKRRERSLSVDH